LEKIDFHYKQKPSPVSFLFTYAICFGSCYLLIEHSLFVSKTILDLYLLLHIPRINLLHELPFGKLLSIPFFIYGLRVLLWNIMSYYEIDTTRIRLLTGYLTRREQFILASDIHEISFKQSLLEAPFRIGSLLLKTRAGEFNIRGVYHVKQVAEDLRRKASYY
jgi:Bacterial PH domain